MKTGKGFAGKGFSGRRIREWNGVSKDQNVFMYKPSRDNYIVINDKICNSIQREYF